MIKTGQVVIEQAVSHEDKIDFRQSPKIRDTNGWLTAIAKQTKYRKLLTRMIIKGDDEVSPTPPELPDAIAKQHGSLIETYEPIPLLRALRICTYRELLELRTDLGGSGACEENAGFFAINQILKEKSWLGLTEQQGIDGGVHEDILSVWRGHFVRLICYLRHLLKQKNSSFLFFPEKEEENQEPERTQELGGISTASLEDQPDIRTGRKTLHEIKCSAAPAVADVASSSLAGSLAPPETPSMDMESFKKKEAASQGVQVEGGISVSEKDSNILEAAQKVENCLHSEVLHGGGLGRDTVAVRSRRIEANHAAIEILENFSDSEISANSNYLQKIATYSGRGSTDGSHLNEYYTQQDIVRFCWNVSLALGCYQGIALEPSCGTGNFIAEAPPTFLVKGVEMDTTSSRIANLLYGDRHSISCEAFQSFAPKCSTKFNLVIGNPPYGPYSIKDVEKDSFLYNESSGKLEQMFVLAAANLTLPDGLFIGVLPYSIVSGQDEIRKKFRNLLIRVDWDFVGAFRLPKSAHKGFGTNFITDIVILKKRSTDSPSPKLKDMRQMFRDGTFFENNPQCILGEEGTERSQYSPESYTVLGDVTPDVFRLALRMVPKFKENLWRWKPPVVRENDVVTLDNETYQFREGRWHQSVITETDPELRKAAIALLSDPQKLLSLDYEEARNYLSLLQ